MQEFLEKINELTQESARFLAKYIRNGLFRQNGRQQVCAAVDYINQQYGLFSRIEKSCTRTLLKMHRCVRNKSCIARERVTENGVNSNVC